MAREDLLQYLILPGGQPTSTPSNPPSTAKKSESSLDLNKHDSESRTAEPIRDLQSDYWRYRGQFQALTLLKSQANITNRKDCKMEVDTAPPAALFGVNTGAGDYMTIDDYLATHTPPAPKHLPPAPKPKAEAAAITLVPRAVGARTSKHTNLLHEKYQALNIPQPEFVFEGNSSKGWWGKVVFWRLLAEAEAEEIELSHGARVAENGDVEIKEKGPFSSKQEAKEKLSEGALKVLVGLEAEGKVLKREKARKVKENTSVTAEGQRQEPSVNYVGQLLEFQRSIASPQPTYTDYQVGTGFTCLLTIDSIPTPFGTLQAPYFSSKKAARHNAARLAVEFFKAQGLWPDSATDVGGIKKKKRKTTPASPPVQAPTPSPDTRSASSSDSPDSPGTPTTITTTAGGESYASRVATLAATLSLPPPSYTSTPSTTAPGFYTVHCSFRNSAHEGPLGEARHIFGKKKAKEECARLTLEYLMSVRETRMSYGRMMMEGVVGGGEVAEVAVGRAVGGDGDGGVEREVVWRRAGRGVEGDEKEEGEWEGDSSGDEGWESALE
ncbi:hypothetical protein CC80DRAFT_564719 [Byssothecium circinans]|uniref:DRBM domain-containing protein n=1 Tax=Byssothecium circinans TaxID=147558 RepID=A0A6A5TRH8_9PLEO|nr:hypothetical protein CC80DRAFT_564719 [Byssothecium circinans]